MSLISRSRFWAVVGVGWLLWGGLYAARLRTVKDGSLGQILHYAYSDAILWAFFTAPVLWLARRIPIVPPHVFSRVTTHVSLAVTISLFHTLLDAMQNRVLSFGSDSPLTIAEFFRFVMPHTFHSNVMICLGIMAIGQALAHYERTGDQRRKVEALRADLAEARLQSLRDQLRPHFLFNSLQTIAALTDGRPKDARRMIQHLSGMLRMSLDSHNTEQVPLREELRLVKLYLEIERVRFGERLQVGEEFDPECLDQKVPPLLLQPLVENAVRHGIGNLPDGGSVTLRAYCEGRQLHLEVEDDGPGFEPSGAESGVGLSSVRRRLQELYGEAHHFQVERCGGRTRVILRLPLSHTAFLGTHP